MLVLSRRPDDAIVFPSVGITVRLLNINGRVAKLGIDAPADVAVLREEVADSPWTNYRPNLGHAAHELCNRLSKLTLGLHLFERQRSLGHDAEANATLERVLEQLKSLDRESVTHLLASPLALTRSPEKSQPRPQALLVEDDPNERELLAGLLRMHGCDCVVAADGAEAIDYLASHDRPDVVLLDMMMPRCDGPTALRLMRAQPRLRGMRIFGVSGSSPSEVGLMSGPDGLDDWFPKPLNPVALCERIQSTVSSSTAV